MQEIIKKNNAWNIRRLVDEYFVPWTQRPSILYSRFSDFYFQLPVKKKPISPVVTTQNIKTDATVQSSVMQPTTNNDSITNPAAGPIGKIRSFFSNSFFRN